MSNITFSGLASGLDTQAIIEALVNVARQPIDRLEAKKSTYNKQLGTLSTLSSRLSSLRTAAQALDLEREFKSYAATTGDSTKLAVSASSSALPGSYAVTIEQLAQAERSYSFAVTAKDQTGLVGSGDLTITVGTTAYAPIQINETTDTLESVAQKINNSISGVSASIIYTGSTFKLVVAGNSTGAANTITFAESGTLLTKLGLSDAGAQVQEAKDARIKIDNNTITRSTNQIADAIPGVTMNLLAETGASTISLTVSQDPDAIAQKISSLVTAYNSVATLIKEELTYSGKVKKDSLMGDAAVRTVKAQLQSIITSKVAAVTGDYSALSRVGITTNREDGTLIFDSGTFKNALANDPTSVARLFTYTDGNESTDNDGIAVRLTRSLELFLRSNDGILPARQGGINDNIELIDDRISHLERNLSSYEQGLRKQFTALESMLASLQNQGSFLSQHFGT